VRLTITDAFLRTLKPPGSGKRLILQDDLQPKLFLRVTSKGKCTWSVLAYLPSGKRVRPTLGQWPTLGISQARKRAEIATGQVTSGIDLTARKRESRRQEAARKGARTVGTALTEWQAIHENTWSERYRNEVKRLCAKLIEPNFGKRPLAELDRDEWTGLITAVRRKTPGTASWLYATVSSFLSHCEAHGWITANPLPRRGRGKIAPQVRARERVVSDNELARIWMASEKLSPKTRCLTRLMIMSACRLDEACNLAMGELDLDAAIWTIPGTRTKNRESHQVPLHPLLLAELRAIWPAAQVSANYRLLGSVAGGGFRAPSKLKAKVDQLSSVSSWRWHDLRRSARSTMSRLGVDTRAAESALNHVIGTKLQRVYDQHDYGQEAIVALQVWQKHVAGLFSDNPLSVEVIPLQVA
jgi:integrase